MLTSKTEVKQQEREERHLFISDGSDWFAEPDNSFQILAEYFLNFCAIPDVTFTDTAGF